MKSGYDIIGDIHGHADDLHNLLQALGYRKEAGTRRHRAGRKAIFLGDFIDRGPKIREVLETVRGMVDAGDALAILGNHEVNAMRFHTVGSDGVPLRPHHSKNWEQHRATLEQFPDPDEWKSWTDWFAGLPLWLDLGRFRAVHACWDADAITALDGIGRLEGPALEKFSRKGTPEYDTISRILNGPEATMPDGHRHRTADGANRRELRVKWWLNLDGLSCREMVFPENDSILDAPPASVPVTGYPADAPPTFFGHYALKGERPAPIRPNLACLDYGMGKGGSLCAYRWDGESTIDPDKIIFIPNRKETHEP